MKEKSWFFVDTDGPTEFVDTMGICYCSIYKSKDQAFQTDLKNEQSYKQTYMSTCTKY